MDFDNVPKRPAGRKKWLDPLLYFCLKNKPLVLLFFFILIGWGAVVSPFDWKLGKLPRNPVPVDAIPDLGENQQIVFTRWSGRSPRDIEDQITAPLTAALLGIPKVKTVRSYSYFGFSTIYLIFEEKVEFYWSRSRILEKLNSLPSNTLPKGIKPSLGPDATALGQIFWYTLEAHDQKGKIVSAWDSYELRKLQDWYIRYALQSASGVSEVASVGGFVPEYQINVDPDKLKNHSISLQQLYKSIREANQEIGARTIEINRVEYVIRARGYLKKIEDIEDIVVKAKSGTPITVKDLASVQLGPAPRRGALDKEGAEVVGGVVIARYGANPLEVIKNIKAKIAEISKGLPQKMLKDGRIVKVKIVPFYDRSKLIHETLETLKEALGLEILLTLLVVLAMLLHLRSSIVISMSLPIAVLICFILMKYAGVDANIVALSGIAIAIGTMVDMGIVLSENILQHLEDLKPGRSSFDAVFAATSEVASAILTSVSTTVISFLPIFVMQASEGKLFRPLAFTKTFALLAALFVSLFLLPVLAHILFPKPRKGLPVLSIMSIYFSFRFSIVFIGYWDAFGSIFNILFFGFLLSYIFVHYVLPQFSKYVQRLFRWFVSSVAVLTAGYYLTLNWMPLGYGKSFISNLSLVALLTGGLLVGFSFFRIIYPWMLRVFLEYKPLFLILPFSLILFGGCSWLGFEKIFSWLPVVADSVGFDGKRMRSSYLWKELGVKTFPGLKKEFMPDLDEGSFLFMPTTMPHASIGEALSVLKKLDIAIRSVPEVTLVVGKIGRAETALDPAPISMVETVIHYKAAYRTDKNGKKVRQWRSHIRSPKDIWKEIIKVTKIPGTTSAPFLQPIGARLVMLQSGMRAPMGIKIKGPSLKVLEKVGMDIEKLLKQVPQISGPTVLADRVVGKPYLEFIIHRKVIARYGLRLAEVQRVIQMAIGGRIVTQTIEGRERYAVVVRYQRELRTDIEAIQRILVSTSTGSQIPLSQLASLHYVRGPQMIKSEDTFLVSYVVFDKKDGYAPIETVQAAQAFLKQKIKNGELKIPEGVSYRFAGNYEDQRRAEQRLLIVLPMALLLILLILYLQFRSFWTAQIIFSGIVVAWAGGFVMLWLYTQPWFLDFSLFDSSLRDLFHIKTYHLSVAVWVGFIALFGIATDDGVVMATYLDQSFEKHKPDSIVEIRKTVMLAGKRRIRPCLMTTATTLLALLPILSSSGRGSDVMIPMAIPGFGGMAVELLTLFVVPVLYCWTKELQWKAKQREINRKAQSKVEEEKNLEEVL